MDAGVGVGDVCYDGVEEEAGVAGFEEFGGLVLEPGVEAALVGADWELFRSVLMTFSDAEVRTVADL